MAAAGDVLLSPVVVPAIAVLVVNDHLFKSAWPGWWTGKLSDFAGALFFPLMIQGAVELTQKAGGKFREPGRGALVAGITVTAALFLVTELTPAGAALVAELTVRGGLIGTGTARLTPDPSDLLALVMLVVAYRAGMSRVRGWPDGYAEPAGVDLRGGDRGDTGREGERLPAAP